MYQQPRRASRRGSYLGPFLTLIFIGLIGVLLFQFWAYFSDKQDEQAENKAAIHIATGSARLKIWGQEAWVNAYEGGVLREGDSFRTLGGSRAVLTLLNGSMIRLDESTELSVEELQSKDGQDHMVLRVNHGDVWVQKTDNAAVDAEFRVVTDELSVRSLGTVFALEKRTETAVRVLEGNVLVDVLSTENGKVRVIENITVSFGQEAVFTEDVFAKLKARKPINILRAVSDGFRNSTWYAWNRAEDSEPTAYVAVGDAATGSSDVENAFAEDDSSGDESSEPDLANEELTAPTVTEPVKADRTITAENVTIRGKASPRSQKIVVTTFVGGTAEEYALQRYEAGSTEWSYIAAASYGNLIPGANRFTVHAVAVDGEVSEKTEFTIVLDKEAADADLSAPVVKSFNNEDPIGIRSAGAPAAFETDSDRVQVSGTVGSGIVKVYVNGFALTLFKLGDTEWSYFAKTEFNNLKLGDNFYEVYGVDASGAKTPVTKFVIKKLKSPTPTVPAAEESEAPVVPDDTGGSDSADLPQARQDEEGMTGAV